jgi:hypothetical protein
MPYIITTTQPCVCTEADDPNDHRKDCPHWYGHDGVSRRAVATLDEAREAAFEAMATVPRYWLNDAVQVGDAIRAVLDQGGTVGPLPDGTVIEVERVDWGVIAGRDWLPKVPPISDRVTRKILDAYNAAQGERA